MKKILLPIANLVSLILVGVAFGLGGISAVKNERGTAMLSYYQLVWQNPKVVSLIGFFALCVGALALLVVFLPKIRKFVASGAGVVLVLAGVMMLLTPHQVNSSFTSQPAFIAACVLVFVAAGLSLGISALEFLSKEE